MRAVTGSLPRRDEVAEWNEAKFLQFFEFVNLFTEGDKFMVRPEQVMVFEQKALSGQYPFLEEMVYRIDALSTDPNAPKGKFMIRLKALVRQVGQYLRLNPGSITDAMREAIVKTPKISWCLTHYTKVETKMGAQVIVPDTKPVLNNALPVQNPADPNITMAENRLIVADLAKKLLKGVTMAEIKKMSVKDRLALGVKMVEMETKFKSFKPNVGTLNLINVNSANRDDLEKAMLEYGQADESQQS